MTTSMQVRIDSDIKIEATVLFKSLGLDMSSAINLFLHQCVLTGGLPFKVEMPKYNKETLEAIEEAKRISKDPLVKDYSSIDELKKVLEED